MSERIDAPSFSSFPKEHRLCSGLDAAASLTFSEPPCGGLPRMPTNGLRGGSTVSSTYERDCFRSDREGSRVRHGSGGELQVSNLLLHVPRRYAETIVPEFERVPNPPRRFSTRECIRAQYREPLLRNGAIWGVGLLALMTYVAFATATGSPTSVLILTLGYLAAIGFIIAPAAIGLKFAGAVREGQLVIGTARHENDDWKLDVPHPRGEFSTVFEPAPEWAAELRPGAPVLVVVHPDKPKPLLILGPRAF